MPLTYSIYYFFIPAGYLSVFEEREWIKTTHFSAELVHFVAQLDWNRETAFT